MMNNLSLISYTLAAALFVILSLLLLTSWRGRLQGALLVSATVMTAIWGIVVALHARDLIPSPSFVLLIEVLRDTAWFVFLVRLLMVVSGVEKIAGGMRLLVISSTVFVLAMLLLLVTSQFNSAALPDVMGGDIRVLGLVMLSIIGLMLVEQLLRNTPINERWAIKFLCLGVGGMFAYDLVLYSDALLFHQINDGLWGARGIINAMVVPLIAVSAARNPQWSLDVFVSRHIVLHTTTFLAAGLYLVVMAAGGYYIRYYGGEWGDVVQVIFYFAAVALLAALLLSGKIRAYIKVLVNKHFYNYKYDYREEWLKFTQALSGEGSDQQLRERVINVIADMVDSPGGVLWLQQKNGVYEPATQYAFSELLAENLKPDDSLINFLIEYKWVIDLDEYRQNTSNYPGLTLPAWLIDEPSARLIIPLMQQDRLCGIVLLASPKTARTFNWEDTDLLRTAGRQAASLLTQLEATQALVNAQQFAAFNRLSAYVVHDLKNVVGQLSLVVANAKKFGHKQEFVDDAMATVGNAVNKMQRMLTQLRQGRDLQHSAMAVQLSPLIEEVVRHRSAQQPVPVFDGSGKGLNVLADPDRLAAVIEHVVQNAQEATPADGSVSIQLTSNSQNAVIEIKDSGCGMDESFIRERLFRPFDTTKGNAGMGIGAYECREFVLGLGGDVRVESQPGSGTLFRLSLPKVSA